MKLITDLVGDVSVVRVTESRLMYPLLSDFSASVVALIIRPRPEHDRRRARLLDARP